jgi:hypothetical protein
MNQPTRCSNYIQVYFLPPRYRSTCFRHPHAHQFQQQPPVHRRNVVVAVLLAVVGPVMGMRMPETCSAVSKRQTINLYLNAASSWLIRLNA